MKPRVGIFGWGIIAPRSRDIHAFRENLARLNDHWLSPFEGFGPNNFLVGTPDFKFADYKSWIQERFSAARFLQLEQKMDEVCLYAIGAFIQSLEWNKDLEQELQKLGSLAHVYIGTSMGSTNTNYETSLDIYRGQQKWDRFWSHPDRNSTLVEYLKNPAAHASLYSDCPTNPSMVPPDQVPDAEEKWHRYWMARSSELQCYLKELAEVEAQNLEGDLESGKRVALTEKQRLFSRLQQKWQAPEPPWRLGAGIFWNLHNVPAAQVSILGRITGLSFAPVAACSTFGIALRLGMSAIQSGDAKAVVIGATDPAPHPINVAAFYSVRVLSSDSTPSLPLTDMRGTHLSGGAAVWILGDYEHMCSRGFVPLGLEPLAVGVSSDADHLITPSSSGPQTAILQALSQAGISADAVSTWDMHATATPGDYQEVTNFRSIFPDSVLVTARKGAFGHGLSVAGGWELTAQYLAYDEGRVFPMFVDAERINPIIRKVHDHFALRSGCEQSQGIAGKLSMGLGGINACVISRPWNVHGASRKVLDSTVKTHQSSSYQPVSLARGEK